MARLMALGRSNFVFNQTPIRAREALLAKTDAKLLLLDGETMFERALPEAAKNFTLKRTSFGASLVKESKALALDLYAISNGGALVKDDYSYYKLFQTSLANPPREIHSIEEIDVGERRFFAVLGEQGKVYSYDFPNGAWARASNPLSGAQSFVTHAPDGSAGLFVVKSDGAILPFNLLTRTYGAPLRDRWLSGVRSYTPYGKDLLKLLADGSVVNASSGSPVREWNGVLVNELVAVPLYDAFEVDR